MAEFEQAYQNRAVFERQKTPFQVIQLAEHRDIKDAVLPQLSVHAYIDGHELTCYRRNGERCICEGYRVAGRGKARRRLDQRRHPKLFDRRVFIGNGTC
jgi:hypothetical protein